MTDYAEEARRAGASKLAIPRSPCVHAFVAGFAKHLKRRRINPDPNTFASSSSAGRNDFPSSMPTACRCGRQLNCRGNCGAGRAAEIALARRDLQTQPRRKITALLGANGVLPIDNPAA